MPADKDLKRLVRARMTKTGESYTAARAQMTRKPKTKVADDAAAAASGAVAVKDYAATAGMGDDAVSAKTGRTWKQWVEALDARGAGTLSHADIAKLLNGEFKVGPWWGQMVAVGYERIKGMRARGQKRDGVYGATKSRTYNVPVETLFDAWSSAAMRRKWLDVTKLKVRTATAPKSMRLDWPDGGIVAVGFVAKGKTKSAVALEHGKLPDRETAERFKQYWSEQLDALGEVLGA